MGDSVLIFTPAYRRAGGADAIHPLCAESVRAQKFAGQIDWHIGRENPYPPGDRRNAAAQYQYAWRLMRSGTWDAMLTLEHDNAMADATALQRMWVASGDIIYAPYLLRREQPVLSLLRYENERNVGGSLSLYPDELRSLRQQGVGRVSGAGFGCTLIRREVVEAIDLAGIGDALPDMPFAERALRAGFVSVARMDAPALHIVEERIMIPFDHQAEAVGVIARQNVVALVGGQPRALIAGERYSLPPEAAHDLLRAGYVEMQPAPAPQRGGRRGLRNAG